MGQNTLKIFVLILFTGSDKGTQGLGPRYSHPPQWRHKIPQGWRGEPAGRGRVRVRPLLRRSGLGPARNETRRAQTQGPLRTHASGPHLCHQFYGRHGPKALLLPYIQEAQANRFNIHRQRWLENQPGTGPLDPPWRCPPLWYKIKHCDRVLIIPQPSEYGYLIVIIIALANSLDYDYLFKGLCIRITSLCLWKSHVRYSRIRYQKVDAAYMLPL